jgi:hypothetical protein
MGNESFWNPWSKAQEKWIVHLILPTGVHKMAGQHEIAQQEGKGNQNMPYLSQ